MKIETLVPDIYKTMEQGAEVSPEDVKSFGEDLSRIISERLSESRNDAGYLRPSNIGERCDRKLWYAVNHPEYGEKLDGETRLKFLLGDLWESILLFLAKVSGHSVEGQQDKMELHGVTGSRDAVIDGVLTDVKSASSYSFKKFQDHLHEDNDPFNYLKQINFYLEASQEDSTVTDKDRAAFFVGDKTLGKLTLDIHNRSGYDYETIIDEKRKMLASDRVPRRGYSDVPDGKSGNKKLGVECSYCAFKHHCWPGLRTFAYSSGPRFLTVVKREPDVTEINT